MSISKLRNLFTLLLAATCLVAVPLQSQAAGKGKPKAQPTKERLVLMPLRLGEEDQKLQGVMETALVEGLQQKYEVFSGEQVARKAREIFMKESKNTAHKECDETRCLQGIAESFQSELLAIANVTKQDGGYFLALSIRNLYDNKDVYSKSLPCEGCNAFQAVNKVKELVGMPTSVVKTPELEAPKIGTNDAESVLWEEVKKGNTAEDYEAYIAQYPKGKFVVLAQSRMKKIQADAANISRVPTVKKTNLNSSVLKDAITIRIAGLLDGRSNMSPKMIGTATQRVMGLSGKEILIDRDVTTLVANSIAERLGGEGYKLVESADAKALYELGGVIKNLTYDVKARDEVFISLEISLIEVATGNVIWSGVETQKDSRFAGVGGSSMKDINKYLQFELSALSTKIGAGIKTKLLELRPDLFVLNP